MIAKRSVVIAKRSVVLSGHRTSISLEPEFWEALRRLAERRGLSLNRLVAEIDERRSGNLSSALRLHVLAASRRGELPPEPQAES